MRKVVISVAACVPGMQIAESIFNEYGAVIIKESTFLDTHTIDKLISLGIERIKIFDDGQNIIVNSAEVFNAQYKENVEVLKDMLHDISIGKKLSTEGVNAVTDSIFVQINENRDIVSCIGKIREVDDYTYTHSVNVSLLCMLMGKWLKMDEEKVKLLVQAGLLHDIGKSMIPSEILNKPGPLNEWEFEEIKKHPSYSYKAIEKVEGISKDVCMGVLMHHEREDGSGYPMGIKGANIHEFAKIIAVADIYDAMTSNRVYRQKESPFEIFEMMEKESYGVLDTKVVSAFLSNIAAYYIGDRVLLSDGQIGEIIFINQRYVSKPLVKIDGKYVDLSYQSGLKILELI